MDCTTYAISVLFCPVPAIPLSLSMALTKSKVVVVLVKNDQIRQCLGYGPVPSVLIHAIGVDVRGKSRLLCSARGAGPLYSDGIARVINEVFAIMASCCGAFHD
jgi:hypothetical protein